MISVCGECIVDLISVDGSNHYIATPGGSPLNIAVGLARLGRDTSLLARIGGGRMGQLLRAHLAAAGVGDRDLTPAAEGCSLAIVSLDSENAASYDFYVDGAADWQWSNAELPAVLPADVEALHVGSIAALRLPGADAILALVERERRRGQVCISLDPNIRPDLIGEHDDAVRRCERLVAAANVIKVSAEDLAWLYPDEPVQSAAGRWYGDGGRLVVVTDGERGALALCPDGTVVHVAASSPSSVVDTVGAGDSFHAAMLAGLADRGLLDPRRLREATISVLTPVLERAARAAGITVGRAGADPPTRAELDAHT